MSIAKDSASEERVLADHETWGIILDPAFCNDPGAADALAHLLFILKKAIASGPEGSMCVINTLQDGIRMVWPYTEEHKLAWELYEIYLSGELKPWDEPRQVLEVRLRDPKRKQRARLDNRKPMDSEATSERVGRGMRSSTNFRPLVGDVGEGQRWVTAETCDDVLDRQRD